MFCLLCSDSGHDADQSMASCAYCGEDLSGTKPGTAVCRSCANTRLRCQCCGHELRLGDFRGVFVDGSSGLLSRADERKIIALLLKKAAKNR